MIVFELLFALVAALPRLKTIVALARRRRFFVTVFRAERDSLTVRVLDFPLAIENDLLADLLRHVLALEHARYLWL